MSKILITFLTFISVQAFAALPLINIDNMSGDYRDSKGNAHAEAGKYIIRNIRISHQDLFLSFDKKEKSLEIKDGTTLVTIDSQFNFLDIFKSFSFEYVDVVSNKKTFSINAESFDLFLAPRNYTFSDVKITTDISHLPQSERERSTIIDSLLVDANFKIQKIKRTRPESDFYSDLAGENPKHQAEIAKLYDASKFLSLPMIIRYVDFDVKNGELSGMAKVDSYINLWFRAWGSVKSNKDNSFLKITIRQAKLGYFTITRTFLRMVKALNLDNVTVKGNVITLKL